MSNIKPGDLVFVYGTLKEGKGNHRVLRESKLLSTTTLRGVSMYSTGGFPFILENDDASGVVVGEVYEVDTEETGAGLDRLEGYRPSAEESSMYLRRRVTLDCGRTAWTYIWNYETDRGDYPKVAKGEW